MSGEVKRRSWDRWGEIEREKGKRENGEVGGKSIKRRKGWG